MAHVDRLGGAVMAVSLRRREAMVAVAALAVFVGVIALPLERRIHDDAAAAAAFGAQIEVASRVTGSAALAGVRLRAARERARALGLGEGESEAERALSRVIPRLAARERVHVALVEIDAGAGGPRTPEPAPAPHGPGPAGAATTAPPASAAAEAGTVPVVLQIEGGYDQLRRFMSGLAHDVPMLEERSWSYASADRSVVTAGERLTVSLACVLHVPSAAARSALRDDALVATVR